MSDTKRVIATRDSILSALPSSPVRCRIREVHVPEWDTTFFVHAISGTERDAWEESLIEETGKGRKKTKEIRVADGKAKLIVYAVCKSLTDPTPLFLPTDWQQLALLTADGLERIFQVAQELAGVGQKAMDETEGN